MKKNIIFLLMCLPLFLSAQKKQGQALIDSLLNELPKKQEDTNKVNLLNTLGRSYYDIDPDEGMKYANLGLALGKRLDFKKGIATSCNVIGGIYSIKGNQPEALKYISDALKLFQEIGRKQGIGNCYLIICTIYQQQNNYPEALKNAFAALKILDDIGDKYGVASCYGNIGNIYDAQHNYPEALKNHYASLKILEEMGYKSATAIVLQNIAGVYFSEGDNAAALKKDFESLKIFEETGDKYQIACSYTNIGNVYNTQKNYPEALKNYYRAADMMEKLDTRPVLAVVLGSIGDIFYKQKKFDVAEKYTDEQLAIGKEIGSLALIKQANESLSEIYALTGRHEKSLEAFKEFVAARDSMFNEENTKKMVQAQMQYDFDKKESLAKSDQEKKDALVKLTFQRKNTLIYGTLSALVALLIIGAMLIRQNKLKAHQQRIELEQKQLRAQMNPHFIFNCLNSIQHFVVANDVKNANKYLSGFASLMRQTLENSKEGSITLRKEIAYLENYLNLELMRFEDKFTAEIACAGNIDIDRVEIPSMIIQPFIENAIRHGLCYLRGKRGILTIKFYLKDARLFCEIDDNGIGREQSQRLKMGAEMVYESHGMELTRQRLALVSKGNGADYEISITDKKNGNNEPEGTTIIIKFPADI